MKLSDGRILTTHAGSLPRPPALTQLYVRRARGEAVDAGELAAQARAALGWVVPRQREAGIDVGNDGEQGREGFFLYVQRRMSGFGGEWVRRPVAEMARYPGYRALREEALARPAVGARMPMALGPVRHLGREAVDAECAGFRAVLAAGGFAEAFLTAPSPGIVATAMRNAHYDSDDAYLAALGEALRPEYEAIAGHGFLLQIDAPDLALERHMAFQDRPLREFLGFVERVIDTINAALANVPRERVRLHVCWGNYEGPHDSDVPLADLLPLLTRARFGALFLPFANPRHAHEVRLLDRVPGELAVVVGAIDTLTNFVEHPEVVADRLERAAQALGDARRVLAGTDCGFDTFAGRGRVAEDVVWAKLRALADGARLASARLF